MMCETIARSYGDWHDRRYRIPGRTGRTGNWKNTFNDEDLTVKRLEWLEVGILESYGMIEIKLVDERGARLQFFMPAATVEELRNALGDRLVALREKHGD